MPALNVRRLIAGALGLVGDVVYETALLLETVRMLVDGTEWDA